MIVLEKKTNTHFEQMINFKPFLMLTSQRKNLTRKGSTQRLSKLQRIILDELEHSRESMTSSPELLSLRVAKRYAPEKIWSLEECKRKNPELYPLARAIHKQDELVRNEFSASFSRSLRNLEKKGLIQLVKGKYELRHEKEGLVYYRLLTYQPRITFIVHNKSRYFGHPNPDIKFIADIVDSIHI